MDITPLKACSSKFDLHLIVVLFNFGVFALDKSRAVNNIPGRIPNWILLWIMLCGPNAWIGAVLAMLSCWHKVRQKSFLIVTLIAFVLHGMDLYTKLYPNDELIHIHKISKFIMFAMVILYSYIRAQTRRRVAARGQANMNQ